MGLAYGATQPGSSGDANRISYLIAPDGKIAHVWPKVDTYKHAVDVLAKITSGAAA